MELLIQKDKSLMDIKNYHYETPLAVAIQKNKIEYVELLLKSGANPNPNNSLEYSPIHLAFINKNFKIVNLLIKYNIDIIHLLTCYIYFQKYEEMVFVINNNNKYLINKKDNNNRTPLVNASFSNNLNMVKFLLENGAISNEDALYYAVHNQNYGMIELLAKYGAKYNNTILDIANKTFNRKIIMFLQNLNTR
jgi:ankyrin repeat protein